MKFAVSTIGTVALVLIAIASSGSARPEGSTAVPSSTPASTSVSNAEEVTPSTTTAVPEESKMSKFFDDVSSAFKTGTAKVKESFESAASSVKDGVLRGYGFVKDKLTGTSDTAAAAATPSNNETVTAASSTTTAAAVTPTSKTVSARSITGNSATAKAIGVEPNDEETKDEDKLIFIGDEDTATDSVVPTTTTTTTEATPDAGSSTNKTKLDDRWIIDGPTACKAGQQVINGKCRNVF